jgi:hypothetical protein
MVDENTFEKSSEFWSEKQEIASPKAFLYIGGVLKEVSNGGQRNRTPW